MQCEVHEQVDRWCISGEMSIYTAKLLKTTLFDRMAAHDGPCRLQLEGVTVLDCAGLQLLLLIHRLAKAGGRAFAVLTPSAAVREALTLVGLQDYIVEAGAESSRRSTR